MARAAVGFGAGASRKWIVGAATAGAAVLASLGGQTMTIADGITPATPAEVEGVLSLAPGTTPGLLTQKLEIAADVDDEDGHHHQRHGGAVSGSNSGSGSTSSGRWGEDDGQGDDSGKSGKKG